MLAASGVRLEMPTRAALVRPFSQVPAASVLGPSMPAATCTYWQLHMVVIAPLSIKAPEPAASFTDRKVLLASEPTKVTCMAQATTPGKVTVTVALAPLGTSK